jgi:hypothetical protein
MVLAIFGLIGVVLGGLLTGGTQVFIEWRRERGAGRRAKRLVEGELFQAQVFLRSVISPPAAWPRYPDVDAILPTSAWREQRVHLADVVDEAYWGVLVAMYVELENDRAHLLAAKDSSVSTPLTDGQVERLKSVIKTLGVLRRALGGGNSGVE